MDTPRAIRRVGPYELVSELGRGGMGAVYRARHVETGVVHALKVVSLGRDDPELTARALARFRREAEVLARIEDHPSLVRIHACGAAAGAAWVAMDLVAGRSIVDRLRAGPLAPREAARLVSAAARGIEHAHALGVVHRDIKPENVLVDERGQPRVVDFGLAFDVFADRLTLTGELLGTPAYMAPEQVARSSDPEAIGPRTDTYGLGALLYACLTGRPPHQAASPLEMVRAIVNEDPPRPSSFVDDVPAGLDAICLRALRRDPAERFPSAAALADDLDRWLRGETPSASTSEVGGLLRLLAGGRRAVGLVVVLAIAIAAALLVVPSAGTSPERAAEILERTLSTTGDLDADQRRGLAALHALGARLDDEARRRVAALDALVRARDGVDGAAAELAELVRPGGELDEPRLRLSERVLHEARRADAIATLLFSRPPLADPSPLVAAELARVLADDGPVPDGDAAFASLLRGARDDEVVARLRVRRGAALLERGESSWPAALALFERAHRDADAVSARGAWPDAFVAWAGDRLRERFTEVRDDAAPLEELLIRVAAGRDPLPPEPAAAFQIRLFGQLGPALVLARGDAEMATFARWLTAGFQHLERHGYAALKHIAATMIEQIYAPPRDPFTSAAEELARDPDRRDPARLLMLYELAHFLAKFADGEEPPTAWIDAADESGLDERWFHFQIATASRGKAGLRHWERAAELDAERPAEERWTQIGVQLIHGLTTDITREQRKSPELHDRLAAIALELADLTEAQAEVTGRFEAAGGLDGPRVLASRASVAYRLQVAASTICLGRPPRCCADGPTNVEALLARARDLAGDRGTVAKDARVRSEHHRAHGRHEEALGVLTAAIEPLQAANDRSSALRRLLEERARLLERMGRDAEAEADRRSARAIDR